MGERKSLGERWVLNIEDGQAKPLVRLHQPEEVGINWGGEGGEAISRLKLGFGARFPDALKATVSPPLAAEELLKALKPQLQAPVIFAPMPIQDAN